MKIAPPTFQPGNEAAEAEMMNTSFTATQNTHTCVSSEMQSSHSAVTSLFNAQGCRHLALNYENTISCRVWWHNLLGKAEAVPEGLKSNKPQKGL